MCMMHTHTHSKPLSDKHQHKNNNLTFLSNENAFPQHSITGTSANVQKGHLHMSQDKGLLTAAAKRHTFMMCICIAYIYIAWCTLLYY